VSESATNRPYKGPESYQVEDAELFFGRDLEAERLTSAVLSARLSLLHAPSGAGKTSLINARLIPNLEARGWLPIRVVPQDNPIEAVRIATLEVVAPPPATELIVLERALKALGGGDPSLAELLGRYDHFDVRAGRRALIAPVDSPVIASASALPTFGKVTPYIARLLRRTIEIGAFAEHITATIPGAGALPIDGSTRCSDLGALLGEPAALLAFSELLSRLYVPVPGLRPFFENLLAVFATWNRRFAVALILDQFEELFTRFVDITPVRRTNVDNLPDWRLRPAFFRELETIYLPGDEDLGSTVVRLPIRCVISMREEYIAQLEPIQAFAPELDARSYHLGFLDLAAAKAAIQEPAKRFGYSHSDDCYTTIIRGLARYKQFVEPAHLQIICDRLWVALGSDLAAEAQVGEGALADGGPLIRTDTLETLGGVQGILQSYLGRLLAELSSEGRLQALDLLDLLITSSGRRNIVERRNLTDAPFRDAEQRDALLTLLAKRSVVRTEWRLGGYFVEITHEFLIDPIRAEIARAIQTDPDHYRLRATLQALDRYNSIDFRDPRERLLPAEELELLNKARDLVSWTPWAVELVLRSALESGAQGPVLKWWAKKYESFGETPSDDLVTVKSDGSRPRQSVFSRDELKQLAREQPRQLPAPQLEAILRSCLITGLREDRPDIRDWTRRFASHGS
jgi:hypothetical protein